MSQSKNPNNLYNILASFNAATKTEVATPKQQAKAIYESVEAKGTIMRGVKGVEKKLSENYEDFKKSMASTKEEAKKRQQEVKDIYDKKAAKKKVDEAMSQQQWEDNRAHKATPAATAKHNAPEQSRMAKLTAQARANGAIPPLAADAKSSSVKEAKADPTGTWVAYKSATVFKKFQTREGMKKFIAAHDGYKSASSEHFADTIQKKKVAEGKVKELSMDLKELTDAEFKAKYKKSKAEMRESMKSKVDEGFMDEPETTDTETGRVHRAKQGGYGNRYDDSEDLAAPADQIARGRGRPKKLELELKRQAAAERNAALAAGGAAPAGRGRPKATGAATANTVRAGTTALQSFMVGNLPSKLPGKAGVKHKISDTGTERGRVASITDEGVDDLNNQSRGVMARINRANNKKNNKPPCPVCNGGGCRNCGDTGVDPDWSPKLMRKKTDEDYASDRGYGPSKNVKDEIARAQAKPKVPAKPSSGKGDPMKGAADWYNQSTGGKRNMGDSKINRNSAMSESYDPHYMAGMKAALSGKKGSSNPYDKFSMEHKLWKQGFKDNYRPAPKAVAEGVRPSNFKGYLSEAMGITPGFHTTLTAYITEGQVKRLFGQLIDDLNTSEPGYNIGIAQNDGDAQLGEKIIRRTVNHSDAYSKLPHSMKEQLVDAAMEEFFPQYNDGNMDESAGDNDDEWYDEDGNVDPQGAYDAGGHYDASRAMDGPEMDEAIDPLAVPAYARKAAGQGPLSLDQVRGPRKDSLSDIRNLGGDHARGTKQLDDLARLAGIQTESISVIGSGEASDSDPSRFNISTNQSSDGNKNVTVTADGEAAVQLLQMLKMAGMGGSDAAQEQEAIIVSGDAADFEDQGEMAMDEEAEYANEPAPQYQSIDKQMSTGDDMNRIKKQSYPLRAAGNNPMSETEQVDELSNGTLGSYAKKANAERSNPNMSDRQADNRGTGVMKAIDKAAGHKAGPIKGNASTAQWSASKGLPSAEKDRQSFDRSVDRVTKESTDPVKSMGRDLMAEYQSLKLRK